MHDLSCFDAEVRDDIKTLRKWITECPQGGMVFFGGAGVSTESSIPDFRSSNGIFMQSHTVAPEQLVSHTFFTQHPSVFYDFYFEHMIFPDAKPNQTHIKLAELEREGILSAIITQNVDGLHQMAGSTKVLELHGSAHRNYCTTCGKVFSLEEFRGLRQRALKEELSGDSSQDALSGVPRCPECGGVVRPDVVLYEEGLDQGVLEASVNAIAQADLLVVAGTSLVVYPAAGLLQFFRGSHLAIVNLQPTSADRKADLCIPEKAGRIFDF